MKKVQRDKKNVFPYKKSIVYPLVEFEPDYNKIYFFLVTINLLKF